MGYFDDLRFIGAGWQAQCRAWVSRSFDDYLGLQFARSGRLVMEHGGKWVTVSGPALWTTGPGPRWRFGVPPPGLLPPSLDSAHQALGWDHRFLTFNGPRARQWLETGLFPRPSPGEVIAVGDPEGMARLFDQIRRAIDAGEHARAVHLTEAILLELGAGARGARESSQGRIARLVASIENDPTTGLDFAAWAQAAGMSYSHFRALFRKLQGLSPHQFLLGARLDAAARLLRREEGSVSALASRCGFDDSAHFNKLFKRRFGLTPGRFREEVR